MSNWAGSEGTSGLSRLDYLNGSSSPDVEQYTSHAPDAANQITSTSVTTWIDQVPTEQTQPMLNDPAGNLIFDGQYVYQYDAWNRLVEVNQVGTLVYDPANPSSDDFDPDGKIDPNQTNSPVHDIGDLAARFAYDGLGRLITMQTVLSGDPPEPVYRTAHYYYDGVRRIQEVVQTPAQPEDQLQTDHEYVYGLEYVDEFILQTYRDTGGTQQPMYLLQDANYNVMALLAESANLETGLVPVLEQYQWEPYGQLAIKDTTATPAPDNHVGHQGLFFYRFDNGTGGTLVSDAKGLYFNRNRWYSPSLGRYTSKDPHVTAQLILSAAAMNGQSMELLLSAFTPQGHFGNGLNLYAYLGSNPNRGHDPLGLYDAFDEVDNWLSDRVGNAMYTIGMLNDVGLGLKTAVGVAASLLPGYGLYEAFQSVQVIASGKGGFWDAVNIAAAAFPLAKGAAKLVGMTGLFKTMGYAARACNCFIAGTPVDTPDGPKPVEAIQEGDEVITRDQDRPNEPVLVGHVTRVFRNLAPVILWLTLSTGEAMGTTPGHEVWTQQAGWTSAGRLQVGDTFVDRDGQAVAVTAIRLDPTPTLVYNFEVNGTFTYFVHGVWVHNNSCDVVGQMLWHFHHALAKFLGGADSGLIVMLEKGLHEEYHGGLLSRLATLRRPRAQKWEDFFIANPGTQAQALDILTTYTQEFDQVHGTRLIEYILKQIGSQGL